MKKASLSLFIFIIIVLTFTGCLFLEKEPQLEIKGPSGSIPFGGTGSFEVEMTSGSAGGVGDVFAKDAEVKSVEWDFVNKDHPAGSFKTTKNGADGLKLSRAFTKAPGQYALKVTITTTSDKPYSASDTFSVLKDSPSVSLEPSIAWGNIQKNDAVTLTTVIHDSQLSEQQIGEYMVQWTIMQGNDQYKQSEMVKYSDSHTFTFQINKRAEYSISVKLVDLFGNTTDLEAINQFEVTNARPTLPVIIDDGWSTAAKGFEIVVENSSDVMYYELHKQLSDSGNFAFVYRGFSSNGNPVSLYDKHATRGETTYRIFGVDGGQSKGKDLTRVFDVPNRKPSKAIVTQPLGRYEEIVFGRALSCAWTGGEDPDGDTVHYRVHLGESKSAMDYLGTTTGNTYPLYSRLESGRTYYIRVDAYDGRGTTTGDIYRFTFDPDVQAPYIDSARYYTRSNELREIWFQDNNANYLNEDYSVIYEIELSQYASFNDSGKFSRTIYATPSQGAAFMGFYGPYEVPSYVYNGNKLFIRMRIVYTNNFMRITTNWSQSVPVTIRN